MNGRPSLSPRPRSATVTSSRPASASKTLLNDHDIHRIFIDPSAGLGSFYDARTECVLDKLPLGKTPIIKTKQHEKVDCTIMKDDTFDTENLFRKIGIHDELWLNSMLNIIPSYGIASVVNYSFPKTTNTRFLYYYYISEERSISPVPNVVRIFIPKDVPNTTATHVISAMRVGIQALIVLQLPLNNETDFDCLLEEIAQQLITNKFEPRREENSLSERIIDTKIFSNIPDLNKISTFTGICQKITAIKPHIYRHYPIEFTLRTIQWFYPLYPTQKAQYIPLELESIKIIKEYLLSLSSQIQELRISLDLRDNETRKKHLNEQYDACRQQIADVDKMYSVEIERIRDLVIKIRSGTMKQEFIEEILINTTEQSLQGNSNLIESRQQALREKEQLINTFDRQNIRYLNMRQHSIRQSDDLHAIFQTLSEKNEPELIFCSTDNLRSQNLSTWNDQYIKWMQEREINSSLTLVYADFTYSSFHLQEVKILFIKASEDIEEQSKLSSLPSPSSSEIITLVTHTSKNTEKSITSLQSSKPFFETNTFLPTDQSTYDSGRNIYHKSSLPSTLEDIVPKEKHRSSSTRSSPNKYINILLLGESGVGKSTFINALLNYHAFNTFEEARSNQPFVAMPVSFLMTVGDQFEEKIVRFGGVDHNEDHDHPGQSVTQHCRSYVFQISPQIKLRIIDTPGMGDTRGLEQDDRNMQHILSFISNLSHLNAICILLKPNPSTLNIVVRSYFTRLLNFLGENARNNIVFCFTNTRATLFALGSTGPLLKEMIKNLPIKDIPFAKTNTFCFDSEAFRYLVALQNGIKFDTYQEKEYQQSWTSSSTVSNHFLQYICAELKPYSQKKWQSIEHAQFQINQLIRPMLETMRNLFRNITLLKEKPSKPLIKLYPIVRSQPAAICYACPRVPKRFRDFWILPDDLHTFADKCNDCDHSKKKHIDVDYKLEYKLIQYEGAKSFDKMNSNLYQLRMAILEFSQLYGYVVDTLKQNDPMLSALKRIIAEEGQICSEKDSTCLNSTLMDIFLALKKEYQDRSKTTISVHVPVDLPSVYELIQNISEMDEISEQMHAIKKAQERYLKQHEKQVS